MSIDEELEDEHNEGIDWNYEMQDPEDEDMSDTVKPPLLDSITTAAGGRYELKKLNQIPVYIHML